VLGVDFAGALETDELVELAGVVAVAAGVASTLGVGEESDFDESVLEESDFETSDFEPRLSFL
jgi:hypothetical protein